MNTHTHTCAHTHTHTHTHTHSVSLFLSEGVCIDLYFGLLTGEVCRLIAEDVMGDEGGSAGAHVFCAVLIATPSRPSTAANSGQISTHCTTTCH